jgi:hypothetical protein
LYSFLFLIKKIYGKNIRTENSRKCLEMVRRKDFGEAWEKGQNVCVTAKSIPRELPSLHPLVCNVLIL